MKQLTLKYIFLHVGMFFYANVLYSQTGPAGIGDSSTNILWLKADVIDGLADGDDVVTWKDTSWRQNHVTQPVANLRPEYKTNEVNGLPVVSFNTANSRLVRNPFTRFATTDITAIYVNKNNGETNDGIISYASSGGNNDFLFYGSQNIGFYRNSNLVTGVDVNGNNWHIVQGSWGTVGGNVEMWKDGSRDYININFNSGNTITSGGSLAIAHEQDSPDGNYANNQDHVGDFAEIIIYNSYLDRADHVIMANYLSAKYDIPLSTNDIYVQDNSANGDYDFEVAGIGQFAPGVLNDDAQGSSFVRILNPSNLNNGEYMIWGHNGIDPTATNTTDIPAGIQARYDREWRVSETNVFGTAVDVGSVDMRWDLSTSGPVTVTDLRLLVDTDNDGIFSDETPISGAVDLGNDIYEFTGVTAITNNVRFTLATINSIATPLPIELINFSGIALKNGANLLEWETATETNNSFFTVKKSNNAVDWKVLDSLKGAGNSITNLQYQLYDRNVENDLIYYQLSQTDFDGTEEIVQTISIKRSPKSVISIFPNPSNGEIYISAITGESQPVSVFNSAGQEVFLSQTITSENGIMQLNLDHLTKGLYLIKIGKETFKIILQ